MERIVVWGLFGVIAGFLFFAKGGTTKELLGGAVIGGMIGAFIGFVFDLLKGQRKN